ncbi:AsmA-like C-terminal region-containing protein [Rubellimicrobium sp. CFH 75288]|uniref:AsmA-like C-terminal region-containing protein n=1 Tax=Rubellimicrobium sp. CFH 75288 TaxID=2697034 RepID=UPI001413245A|nr:AsmA-like C-terminal region-containing protein [Rubellimicrobium sp. CFH 75288]NAZ36017.1 DUF3971 domain-containing protein [Rubellimicrobium sp. CFH 75288]
MVLLAGVAALLMVGREVAAPDWLRRHLEAAATEALGGAGLEFGAITLRIPADLRPGLRLVDVRLHDPEGRLVARVPEITATLSPRGLLFERRPLIQHIGVVGAEIWVGRSADGSLDLAVGTGSGGPSPLGRAAGLWQLPERFERLFDHPRLAALRRVEVTGLVANYDDLRAGRSWTLDGGNLLLDLSGAQTRLTAEVTLLSGRAYASRARLDYGSPRGSPEARFGLVLTDVAARDVASQSPALAWLGAVDAPVSAALRGSIDAGGGLGPLALALKVAPGELRPDPRAPGIAFDLARAYLAYDPAAQEIRFDRLEIQSERGAVTGAGVAWPEEFRAGLPRALVGQFRLTDVVIASPGLYPEPQHWPEVAAQMRLRLDPFAVEVAQAEVALPDGDGRLVAQGRLAPAAGGWEVALDGRLDRVGRERVLAVWPPGLRPGLRAWVEQHVSAAQFEDVTVALRLGPGQPARFALSAPFHEGAVRPLASHPPVEGAAGVLSWSDGGFALRLDRGWTVPRQGGTVDLGGTGFVIPPSDDPRVPARVDLVAAGSVEGALALLDEPPWSVLTRAGLPVDLAEGRAEIAGRVDLLLGGMGPGDLRYDVAASLRDVESAVLVPGRRLTADRLAVRATEAEVLVEGAARLDGVPLTGRWRQVHAEGGRSRVEADGVLTPATLAAFGVALPPGTVRGEGRASVVLDLVPGSAPVLSVRSDLAGLSLSLPQIGWSKGAATRGTFALEGRLGAPPVFDSLTLAAPGLSAAGRLVLGADGGFRRLDLSRLRVGDWLDAPVALIGAEPRVELRGGALDLRRAALGGTGGEGGGGPVAVALDRLQVTDAIALTRFEGEFTTARGLEGEFTAQVNEGPRVVGRVAPQAGRVGVRIRGDNAGAVMRAAGLFERAEGGSLDLLLLPVDDAAYSGELFVQGLRVRDAPALASLLNAASVVGLLQQLGGQGILFDEVRGEFRLDPRQVTVSRSSAVGAGLGLSLDGIYDLALGRMDFQGVLSPFYLVNGIGAILTRRGEGLIGFNFRLRGDPAAPQVSVNPLSALTPGFFREIFRRPPPV